MILIYRDSAARADVLAAVGKTAAAEVRDLISARWTFVAGNVQDLDNVWI